MCEPHCPIVRQLHVFHGSAGGARPRENAPTSIITDRSVRPLNFATFAFYLHQTSANSLLRIQIEAVGRRSLFIYLIDVQREKFCATIITILQAIVQSSHSADRRVFNILLWKKQLLILK